MAELLHNPFNLLLTLDFDFILFVRLIHSLSEYLENRRTSFAPQVVEFDIIDWWLLKTFNNLSSLFVYLVVGIYHINSSFKTPFFHQHVNLEKQSFLGLRLGGRARFLGWTRGRSIHSVLRFTHLRLRRSWDSLSLFRSQSFLFLSKIFDWDWWERASSWLKIIGVVHTVCLVLIIVICFLNWFVDNERRVLRYWVLLEFEIICSVMILSNELVVAMARSVATTTPIRVYSSTSCILRGFLLLSWWSSWRELICCFLHMSSFASLRVDWLPVNGRPSCSFCVSHIKSVSGIASLVEESCVGTSGWASLRHVHRAVYRTSTVPHRRIRVEHTSTQSLLHPVLVPPHVLLAVVLYVAQNLFAVVLIFMPLNDIESALLLLEPLEHLLIL